MRIVRVTRCSGRRRRRNNTFARYEGRSSSPRVLSVTYCSSFGRYRFRAHNNSAAMMINDNTERRGYGRYGYADAGRNASAERLRTGEKREREIERVKERRHDRTERREIRIERDGSRKRVGYGAIVREVVAHSAVRHQSNRGYFHFVCLRIWASFRRPVRAMGSYTYDVQYNTLERASTYTTYFHAGLHDNYKFLTQFEFHI
jgi:hypothetical protein